MSTQVFDWLQANEPELHKLLVDVDITADLELVLQAVDELRLKPELQVAVHRVRSALGVAASG